MFVLVSICSTSICVVIQIQLKNLSCFYACFAMFLLCFCYVFAVICYAFAMFLCVLLCFLVFCYPLLFLVMFCYALVMLCRAFLYFALFCYVLFCCVLCCPQWKKYAVGRKGEAHGPAARIAADGMPINAHRHPKSSPLAFFADGDGQPKPLGC